jgi:hypothetical protein
MLDALLTKVKPHRFFNLSSENYAGDLLAHQACSSSIGPSLAGVGVTDGCSGRANLLRWVSWYDPGSR